MGRFPSIHFLGRLNMLRNSSKQSQTVITSIGRGLLRPQEEKQNAADNLEIIQNFQITSP